VRLKLDENLPRRAVGVLTRAGYQVDTVVEEGLGGASDPQVLTAATAARRLLITLDRGLGDVRAYPPGSHAGVLVLRPADQSAASVSALLEQLLAAESLDALAGLVAVAQPGLLRIRRP
jgi:predicted nuclease of predicted toxin-antitoxin system